MQKHKDSVLKDLDIVEIGFRIRLDSDVAGKLIENIKSDTECLRMFNLTDYSLLITVHTGPQVPKRDCGIRVVESHDENNGPIRQKLMFTFSLIDFLAEYDLKKAAEKNFKKFAHYVSRSKDDNISAEDAEKYALRMQRYFAEVCIEKV